MIADLLTVAVLGFVGFRLVTSARTAVSSAARRHMATIVRGMRAHHFLLAPVAFAVVITVAILLLGIPGMSIGWWTAIGGTGNIVTGGTSRTHGTALEWIVPAIFLSLLFPALPLFAEREELMFRRGAEGWSWRRRCWMGLKFGLVHLVMGIPIGVAIALSFGGWYFQWAYLRAYRKTGDVREAVLESTRSHLAYNAEILSLAVVALIVYGSLS
jgi:hypothetical protein